MKDGQAAAILETPSGMSARRERRPRSAVKRGWNCKQDGVCLRRLPVKTDSNQADRPVRNVLNLRPWRKEIRLLIAPRTDGSPWRLFYNDCGPPERKSQKGSGAAAKRQTMKGEGGGSSDRSFFFFKVSPVRMYKMTHLFITRHMWQMQIPD